jgi:N-acyl-D-amino-acid deacylase
MSKVDLVIRGGTVADGTGASLREADIAIDGGRITEVGAVGSVGREEIDAKGLLVTPGFIDVHTHYDGQLTWSDQLSPSSLHGVTSVVVGNCGVGFAPCRPADRDALIRIMDGVEDIPEVVMAEGLPWNWQSFTDYMTAVEAKPHDIDFAVLVPHAPLRVFVMGQRALNLEPATAEDRAKMRQIVQEAVRAGASGFSTSRNIFHRASDGSYLPMLKAEEAELEEIATGLAEIGRGVIQGTVVDQFKVEEYEFMNRIAAKSGRPLSYTLIQADWAQNLWREASMNPFCMHPYYIEHLAKLPMPERVARMRDPQVRATLLQFASGSNHPYNDTIRKYDQIYVLGETPDYEPDADTSIAATAARLGKTADEVAYGALLQQEGRAKLFVASSNYAERNLDNTLELMRHKDAVVALGDGGAHYGVICDASYSTYMLTHWVRDRKRGERLTTEEAVRMLTDAPARLQGFHDRGRIAPGMKADINVIDMDRLKIRSPHVVFDLPGGGKRLTQEAEGYVATLVSGVPIRRNGEDTGVLQPPRWWWCRAKADSQCSRGLFAARHFNQMVKTW